MTHKGELIEQEISFYEAFYHLYVTYWYKPKGIIVRSDDNRGRILHSSRKHSLKCTSTELRPTYKAK